MGIDVDDADGAWDVAVVGGDDEALVVAGDNLAHDERRCGRVVGQVFGSGQAFGSGTARG